MASTKAGPESNNNANPTFTLIILVLLTSLEFFRNVAVRFCDFLFFVHSRFE